MTCRAGARCLLALLLALAAVRSAAAQTPEFGGQAPGPGEGGAGRSVGGNIPVPAGALPSEEEKPAAEPWYSAHAQATVILMGNGPFHSPYAGPNSFQSMTEMRTTMTGTLYLAVKMPWEGGLVVVNPEVSGGRGPGDVFGLGGPPNGEAVRVGNPQPTAYFARFLYQQTFELGGEWERLADLPNQIPEPRYKNNIVIKVGKMTATDDFDDNTYSHDPRTQFMNWGLMFNPTWDYPANVRGYTYGGDVEMNLLDWSFRYGAWVEPIAANAAPLDPHFLRALGQAVEFEQRWTVLNGQPGAARLLAWLNSANMGSYREALQMMPDSPDVTLTRHYRLRYGFGLSWEQEVLKDEMGVFGRLGIADSHAETWAFTEVERTASIGLLLKGKRWNRPRDEVGLALLVNGIGPQHRDYLAAGGLGFELGDGRLSYAPEATVETYYNLRLRKGINVTLDLQEVNNPGYNRDRGPIFFVGFRTHFEY